MSYRSRTFPISPPPVPNIVQTDELPLDQRRYGCRDVTLVVIVPVRVSALQVLLAPLQLAATPASHWSLSLASTPTYVVASSPLYSPASRLPPKYCRSACAQAVHRVPPLPPPSPSGISSSELP